MAPGVDANPRKGGRPIPATAVMAADHAVVREEGAVCRLSALEGRRIGIFGDGPPWPGAVAQYLAANRAAVETHGIDQPPPDEESNGASLDAAIVIDPPPMPARPGGAVEHAQRVAHLAEWMNRLQAQHVGIVRIGNAGDADAEHTPGAVWLPRDTSLDVLQGVLAGLAQIRPIWDHIEAELSTVRALGDQLRRYFEEVQQDLALASRLQRDFLPRELPAAPPMQFATLFRPCSWVSGDIFDVFRIDEHRVGFYLFDAMGHGVSAALLTMFIRTGLRTKRIHAQGYEPMQPGEVLGDLNETLVDERLPDCQFVTGWYGVIDTRTLELTFASAGHPPPLLVSADGSSRPLVGAGGLLGVFGGQDFPNESEQLQPGDRVLLYSDGLEAALTEEAPGDAGIRLHEALSGGAAQSAKAFVESVATRLDNMPGAFSARTDDMTLVLAEVGEPE